MEIYTIGFAKKTAAQFFGALKDAHIHRLLDVRLNNSSQLAGFTKQRDLPYFLKEICGVEYLHEPLLAPTQEILTAFKKKKGKWEDYERSFLELMVQRRIEDVLLGDSFVSPTVLLCSEPTPEHCHRRLVAEYLQARWGGIRIIHL